MLRPRLTIGALILIGLLAVPALVMAGDINTTGAIEGDFMPQKPTPEAACNPGAPATPEDNLCEATSEGVVELPTVINIGTYTASMLFDHSIAATEPDCAAVTGTMVMTTPTGTITFTIQNTSRACFEFIFAEADLEMTVASGTGAFAGMTGFLHASGGIGPTGGKGGPVGFAMVLEASGNIIAGVTPTATATASATTAPTGTATAAPAVSLLPNAAVSGTDASAGVLGATVILLGALLVVSSGAYVARRARR
jgi:hypothetical protein